MDLLDPEESEELVLDRVTSPLSEGERQLGMGLGIGAFIGPYLLDEVMKSGGFGSVVRAIDTRDDTKVAIKVLHPQHMLSTAVQRFQREVAILRQLSHPNVVRVLELGTLDDGRPYCAMELLEGEDLGTRLKRGPLSADEVVAVFTPLCDALAAAHAADIIHRDVKPSNVFLARQEGGGTRVVLLDFGVAKLRHNDAGITASRQAVGTPSYMAPEQILGTEVTARTDVYALGALAFACITRHRPWGRLRPEQLMLVAQVASPPRMSQVVPVSRELDDVVARAMAQRPADRYATPREFLAALEAGLSRELPAVRLASPPARSLVLRADLHVPSADLEAPDDRLLDEIDAISERLADALPELGLTLQSRVGQQMTFTGPAGGAGEADRERRAALLRAVVELHDVLVRRPDRDPRVTLRLALDIDDGDAEPTAWEHVPPAGDSVVSSPAVVADLTLVETPTTMAGGFVVLRPRADGGA